MVFGFQLSTDRLDRESQRHGEQERGLYLFPVDSTSSSSGQLRGSDFMDELDAWIQALKPEDMLDTGEHDDGRVRSNVTSFSSEPTGCSLATGMLDITVSSFLALTVNW